ncbi:hypothetical protein PHJA_000838500 [Phtheirospermum japonicum]|uniref:Uncharacterized protein n=1 Tax=Phtheirospermum japonicum TaxID=374723 RepID=A0A830BHV5_9LAMI|nr:hypothetical protein PHJA_000838500 [Phtheirospermum japonicum]
MIEVINDVLKVTVSVSALLFGGVSSAFRKPGLSFGVKSKNVRVEGGIREFQEMDLGNLRKKGDEELKIATKKMHELEDRILEIQGCGERAFRSLINTRVSLLNAVTQ